MDGIVITDGGMDADGRPKANGPNKEQHSPRVIDHPHRVP
jgi:hypothetical protein